MDQVRAGRPLPDIWLLNGKTAEADRFVERDYLKRLVWEYSDKTIAIPDDKFTLDSALNTSQSVDHFAADFSARGRQKAALFTDSSHSRRFGMLTCARHIPARVFSAEDVLIEHRPDLAGILGKSMDSPYMRQKNDREFAQRLTLLWFPHGEFLTYAKEYVVSHPDSVITQILSPTTPPDNGSAEPAQMPADTSE